MFRKTVARHSIRERPRLGGLGEASLVRALPLLLLLVPLASASSRAGPVRLPLAKADLTLADRAAFHRALGWCHEGEAAFQSPDERSLVHTAARELSGLPPFARRTRQLRILNKFRGPGDCGTLATYRFVEGVPELAELRAKLACDGKGAEAPERWPPVPPH